MADDDLRALEFYRERVDADSLAEGMVDGKLLPCLQLSAARGAEYLAACQVRGQRQ